MNDDRRAKLRKVLTELERVLREESEALDGRPENLQASPQHEFHEKRWIALEECVEQLKRAIFDYDFRMKDEYREVIETLEELKKNPSKGA